MRSVTQLCPSNFLEAKESGKWEIGNVSRLRSRERGKPHFAWKPMWSNRSFYRCDMRAKKKRVDSRKPFANFERRAGAQGRVACGTQRSPIDRVGPDHAYPTRFLSGTSSPRPCPSSRLASGTPRCRRVDSATATRRRSRRRTRSARAPWFRAPGETRTSPPRLAGRARTRTPPL